MGALDALLWQQNQEEMLSRHTNALLWSVGRFLHKDKCIGTFDELTKLKIVDNRTADELVDDMAARVRKRIEQRRRMP